MSFEEQFPSLKKEVFDDLTLNTIERWQTAYTAEEIEKHCLDKQQVREIINERIKMIHAEAQDGLLSDYDKHRIDTLELVETLLLGEKELGPTMSFEEQFPRLRGLIDVSEDHTLEDGTKIPFIDQWKVEQFCLDKQRVRDAINKAYTLSCPHGGSKLLVEAGVKLREELGL